MYAEIIDADHVGVVQPRHGSVAEHQLLARADLFRVVDLQRYCAGQDLIDRRDHGRRLGLGETVQDQVSASLGLGQQLVCDNAYVLADDFSDQLDDMVRAAKHRRIHRTAP